MSVEHSLKADHDIVASWVAGWALARELGPPTPAFGGFLVEVGLPEEKARYVFSAAVPGVREASLAIQEPNIFLKVCSPPELVQPLLHAGWSIKPIRFMMTTENIELVESTLPANYRCDVRRVMTGYVANIATVSGELAASGRAFLVGRTAVFDSIETHPSHRRRGLGRTVMRELGRLTVQAGASMGALVATPDGRALYRAMGWEVHSLYTTAVREGGEQVDGENREMHDPLQHSRSPGSER